MLTYLFIGGENDGMILPASSGTEIVLSRHGVSKRETYICSKLTIDNASIAIYIHKSLSPDQVILRLVERYQAWSENSDSMEHNPTK